jgi:conjugative transfer signal peptidase TraF
MIYRGLLALLSGVLAVWGIAAAFQLTGIRVNASASLPIGLYRTTSDKSGKLVEFCPSEPHANLSAKRAYRGKGNCPDGAEPLMKPIIAVPGDVVEESVQGVAVNGRLLPNSRPLLLDTKGRRLEHWRFGTYCVPPNSVWVISSFNHRSFDSRYFGPIASSSIRSHLSPFLTE